MHTLLSPGISTPTSPAKDNKDVVIKNNKVLIAKVYFYLTLEYINILTIDRFKAGNYKELKVGLCAIWGLYT